MTASAWARLLGLAGIWSLQYLFLRVAAPVFGSGLTAEARSFFGALVLVPAALLMQQRMSLLGHWKDHLALSVVNNVLPFLLFAYAATTLPTGYLSIINGMVPLFAALFAAWLLHERLGARRACGFSLGLAGVALTVNLGPVALDLATVLATAAALAGAAAWAYAGVMIKQRTGQQPPIAVAAGTTVYSALLLSPFWGHAPQAEWTLVPTLALIGVGVLCSGVAYFAFFTLIRDIGPSRTLSVGFMIPVLGVLWGWLLLGEPVTLSMVFGGGLVLAAMALVLRR